MMYTSCPSCNSSCIEHADPKILKIAYDDGHHRGQRNLKKPEETSRNPKKPEETSRNLKKPQETSRNLKKPQHFGWFEGKTTGNPSSSPFTMAIYEIPTGLIYGPSNPGLQDPTPPDPMPSCRGVAHQAVHGAIPSELVQVLCKIVNRFLGRNMAQRGAAELGRVGELKVVLKRDWMCRKK